MPAVSNPNAGPSPEYDAPLRECPLCDSQELRHYDCDYEGRRVDRCRDCDLLFMNPQYTERYLNAYYSQYFHDGETPAIAIGDPEDGSRRSAAKADLFRFLDRYATPGRFLSIGCSDGIELKLAQQFGWNPEGYDVDEGYMSGLRKQLGCPIYSGDFFNLALPDEHYDCVFMDQVLEHPKNPQDYLREVRRILKPGGVLYIGCPNIRSLSSRLKTLLGKAKLKRRRGRHYDMFHHLFFYDPRTLKRILESHYGYHVVVAQGDPMTGHRSQRIDDNWRNRLSYWAKREFPILESSFRLLAQKPVDYYIVPTAPSTRHAA